MYFSALATRLGGNPMGKREHRYLPGRLYIYNIIYIYKYNYILVGGLEPWNFEWLSIQLGMSSSQLTNSYFSEGLKPPTRYPCVSCFPIPSWDDDRVPELHQIFRMACDSSIRKAPVRLKCTSTGTQKLPCVKAILFILIFTKRAVALVSIAFPTQPQV